MNDLEAAAGHAVLTGQIRSFTAWAGAGRKLTQTARIGLADARHLMELPGTGDTTDPKTGDRVFKTKSSEEPGHLTRIVEWAKAARLVRVTGTRLLPVKKNASLLDRALHRAPESSFEFGRVPGTVPSLHGEHQLAGVLAGEQLGQGIGECAHTARKDVFAGDQPALAQPSDELSAGLGIPVGVVGGEHPGHRCAGGDQRQVIGRAADLVRVVLRDAAAEHDPGSAREPGEHRVENVADVVDEHVDAAGRVLPQRPTDVLSLVVDGHVETEVPGNPAALLRPARDPDHPAPLDLGDLPGHAADGTGRPRDDDRLGLAQAADVEQPELRSQAAGAERPEVGRQRREQRVELGHARAVGAREVLDPNAPYTCSPAANAGCREPVTRPTAPASMTAPIATGSR